MNISPKVRTWTYSVVAAAIPLLIIAGLLTPDAAALWLGLAAAILGLGSSGLAVVNRPTKTSTDNKGS